MKQRKIYNNLGPVHEGISLKKEHGQHFLRDESVITVILQTVTITSHTSLLEIGCGDGTLTRALLQTPAERIWVFEIDPEWAGYVQKKYPDPRLTFFVTDIVTTDLTILKEHLPWILVSNLPYKITFPILHLMKQYHTLWSEGVIMVQEEVAQKLVATSGRAYGWQSLYFQYYFDWKLLIKIPPSAFYPPPRVTSRLIYWKPRHELQTIPDEERFWKFVKACFAHPRRTLRNNLLQTGYGVHLKNRETTWDQLRAQQMSFEDFLNLWIYLRQGHGACPM